MTILTLLLLVVTAVVAALVVWPLLREYSGPAAVVLHMSLALILTLSLLRVVVAQLTGEAVTRPIVWALIAMALYAACAGRALVRPQPLLILAYLCLAILAFRDTDLTGDIAISALTLVTPLFIAASFLRVHPEKLAVVLFVLGIAIIPVLLLFGDTVQGRLASVGENPIWIARVACLCALGSILTKRAPLLLRAVVVVILVGVIWLTGSRGPLLALAAAIFLYPGLVYTRGKRVLAYVLTTLCTIAAALIGESSYLENRADGDASIRWREVVWAKSIRLIESSPWFGTGRAFDAPGSGLPTYPHNFVLEVGVQAGLVGIFILTILLVIAWRRARSPELRTLLFAVVLFTLTSGSLWSSYEFWALIGICCAFSIPSRRVSNSRRARKDSFRRWRTTASPDVRQPTQRLPAA